MSLEKERLEKCRAGIPWKKWGPYLTERQWGTVREDYSPTGSAWEFISHDAARSKAYRWGEEGIAGISDDKQFLCFSLAFWNGKDPIIKERMFGLTGNEGNHGEDPKEYWYYLDNTPTHSYMKMLYKYPQNEFPYSKLVHENQRRSRFDPEYELVDTGIFSNNQYFDIFVEYAKADTEDILIKITVQNRNKDKAFLNVLPTVWFRNTWSWNPKEVKPSMKAIAENAIKIQHPKLGQYYLYCDGDTQLLFCDNETNYQRLYNVNNPTRYCKDGINEFIVHSNAGAINLEEQGTKAAANYYIAVEGESEEVIRLRLTSSSMDMPFSNFYSLFRERKLEADEFYKEIQQGNDDEDLKNIQRQAFAGMLWGKQFYYFNVAQWLDGDPGQCPPPEERKHGRNSHWRHLDNADIISMPDKWEYPWYAAWDSAFHCVPLARIDVDFAKDQLLLFLKEWYMHPNGQIPAYEWNFGDVNPPVHAWATLRVYQIDKKMRGGVGDTDFLEKAFHKLLLNFTWWVNQKDAEGNNIFEGGFLGLDNIGVFDRSRPLPTGGHIEQADGTSWMAMYSLNMLRISLELAVYKSINYQETASKFLEHFLYIAGAMNNIGGTNVGLWDDEDNFYYDILHLPHGGSTRLKVRSMVGLIPLFAVENLKMEALEKLPYFRSRLDYFMEQRPDLASLVARWVEPGVGESRLLSLLRGYRMKMILQRMLDETEFLSDYGIRALSKYHKDHPYHYHFNGTTFTVAYLPGESDSGLFGGNSNWRGPIWFPVNYLIIESLLKFYNYYGDDFKIEYPSNSGTFITIKEVAAEISKRLMRIFMKDENGNRPVYNNHPKLQSDPYFRDYLLFYEYFHGDNGSGIGANHQTGWTGLIADMIHKFHD
ncbi:MAG TPA: glucosidase [Cytophagaceae bacterium]